MITENFNILNELKEAGAENIITAGKGNCFSVPENYFNTLPGNIMAHVFLQSVPFVNPYTAPYGYFEGFSAGVLEKIEKSAGAVLPIEKTITYNVPEGYFDTLAGNILNRIKQQPQGTVIREELESISPFLDSIPKTNVYTVPDGYFEGLTVPVKQQQPEPARVISLGRTKKWMNYAAAASVAILLLGGGYVYLGKARTETPVAAAPASNVEAQISRLSDEEIKDYLRTTTNMAVYTSPGADEYQPRNMEMDVQNMLQNVSDEEIQQYLDQGLELTHAEEGI